MLNSLATRRMKLDPGSVWLFSIPSMRFFLKPCFSGVSGLSQDCEELGSLTPSKLLFWLLNLKHEKSVFGLDEMSSGIVRFTEEAASQAPKMLANTHVHAVLEYRKDQRKTEWNSRILCSVGEHTFFFVVL